MKKIISLVSILVVGGLFGYFIGKYFSKAFIADLPTELSKIEVIGLVLLMIPIYFIVVGFHELGHALVGRWVGFDFKMFIVWPLLIEKSNNGISFKLNKSLNLAGGLVVSLPQNGHNLKNKFSWYAAGGPLFSLLLIILAIGVQYLLPSSFTFVLLLCKIIAFLSFLIFIVTIIPSKAGGFSSDGARILRLQRAGEVSELELGFLGLIAKTSASIRPKDLDIAEIEKSLNLANKLKESYEVYLLGYLFQAQFDKGLIDLAKETLELYLSKIEDIPAPLRGSAWLDASFFYAFSLKNLEKAKEFFSNYKPNNFIPKSQIYITEAAIMYLENKDHELIKEKLSLSEVNLNKTIDKGMIEAYREKIEVIKSWI